MPLFDIPRRKRGETKKLAYIGFTFENVEGIWLDPHVVKNLAIINVKENFEFFDNFDNLTSFPIAEEICFSISKKDLLDISKQNLVDMHLKELTSQEAKDEHLNLIMNHFIHYNDIVSIDFYYEGEDFHESIFTDWDPLDPYTNQNAKVTLENEIFHFQIKGRGE